MNDFPMYDNSAMSPNSAGLDWQPQHSQTVAQHFGQITPITPREDDLKMLAHPTSSEYAQGYPTVQHSARPSDSSGQALSRTERARAAANSRHSKAKRARKDSFKIEEDVDGDNNEVEGKREKYREKNR